MKPVYDCTWGILTNGQRGNIAFPETDASYWTQPLSMRAGDTIVISGKFPAARFISFTTYFANGAVYSTTPISTIVDAQLSARRGVNYYASTVAPPYPPAKTGWYKLHITAGPPSLTKAANLSDPTSIAVLAAPVLPITPTNLTGWLMYRVFDPYVRNQDQPIQSAKFTKYIQVGGLLSWSFSHFLVFRSFRAIQFINLDVVCSKMVNHL